MIRLGISVEGQTEQEFVRKVLAPHLWTFGIDARASIVNTRTDADGTRHKGGSVSVERAARNILPLLGSFDWATTFYDLYGFNDRHPDEGADELEARLADRLNNQRFVAYIQQYEFEALLFASPDAAERVFASPALRAALADVSDGFATPEHINDSRETSPSHRLETIFAIHLRRAYDKVVDGMLLLENAGLPSVRTRCPRFNVWLNRLESLAGT